MFALFAPNDPQESHLEQPPSSTPPSYQPTTTLKLMQRRMVHTFPSISRQYDYLLTHPQLSKEDEAATGADEIEVRREDQDKINKFSRLHQRELNLEDELKAKHVCATLRVAGLEWRRC
jgi:hypothetical protein